MGSLRSFGTWPHPNHQQPITEQETEKIEKERVMQQTVHIVNKKLESKRAEKLVQVDK